MSAITKQKKDGLASESLAEWLTQILELRISNGQYKPGEWLRENALREEFGLSNGPVREALQNLVAIGALVREAKRGVHVVSLTDDEVVGLLEVRVGLLELAVELAVHHATEEDLTTARQFVDEINDALAAGRLKDAFPLLGEMIDRVCAMSNNDFLFAAWNNRKIPARIYVFASYEASKRPAQVFVRWNQVVAAIVNRDVSAARNAVRTVYKNTLQELGLEGRSAIFASARRKQPVDVRSRR